MPVVAASTIGVVLPLSPAGRESVVAVSVFDLVSFRAATGCPAEHFLVPGWVAAQAGNWISFNRAA